MIKLREIFLILVAQLSKSKSYFFKMAKSLQISLAGTPNQAHFPCTIQPNLQYKFKYSLQYKIIDYFFLFS